MGYFPTRVRLVLLRQTGMGCMTWQGTSGSGVGTGMMFMAALHRLILVVQHRLPATALLGAALGAVILVVLADVARRLAATAGVRTTISMLGSAASCPQVSSELKQIAEQAGAARDERLVSERRRVVGFGRTKTQS